MMFILLLLKVTPSFQRNQRFLLENANTGLVFEDGILISLPAGSTSSGSVSAPLHRYPGGVYFWMLPQEFTGNKV